jgi:hypothetical protein
MDLVGERVGSLMGVSVGRDSVNNVRTVVLGYEDGTQPSIPTEALTVLGTGGCSVVLFRTSAIRRR